MLAVLCTLFRSTNNSGTSDCMLQARGKCGLSFGGLQDGGPGLAVCGLDVEEIIETKRRKTRACWGIRSTWARTRAQRRQTWIVDGWSLGKGEIVYEEPIKHLHFLPAKDMPDEVLESSL
jgi:hypothetical protein